MRRLEFFLSVVALTAACGNNPTNNPSFFDDVTDASDDVASDATSNDASDATPADVDQPDAPVDAPVVDAPDVDASVADAPVADAPVADAPVADAPVADAPVVDAPVVDAPVVDAPVVDAPVVDVPVVDAPADVRTDVVSDATTDARTDVVSDATTDATADASTDAAADAVVDASPTVPGPLHELWILRVGDGTAALTSAAAPLFIERRASTDGATRAANLALPIAVAGTNRPISLSGTAGTEGALSRSVDGRFVTLAGYAAAPGLAGVATSTATATPRVVARVDSTGAINTATSLGMAFSGGNVRGATTVDGTAFWASGTGSPGGIEYQLLGAAAEPVAVVATPSNLRAVGTFGGRLYGSAGAGGFYGVFSVGASGTPTTADAPATLLSGFPTASGPSPYGFAMLDRDPAVAGLDTVYVADDRSVATGGGVQRWTLTGTTWTLGATFSAGITSGTRGVTAWIDGADAVIAAVTAESASRVVLFRDRPGLAPTAALPLATAPANTQYRGVVLAPAP